MVAISFAVQKALLATAALLGWYGAAAEVHSMGLQADTVPHDLWDSMKGNRTGSASDAQVTRRLLLGESPLPEMMINEMRADVTFGGGTIYQYFELVWGPDMDPLDFWLVYYHPSTGGVLGYQPFSASWINFGPPDEYGVRYVPLIYPNSVPTPGMGLLKSCAGGSVKFVECFTYATQSFATLPYDDGFVQLAAEECKTTGVFDAGLNNPRLWGDAISESVGPARTGFCPGGAWRSEPFSFGGLNHGQQVDAAAADGFPVCPDPCTTTTTTTTTTREECMSCRRACEAKAGFELERADDSLSGFGHHRDDDDGDIMLNDDAPNCDPSSGGWWCCVSSDVNNDKIYDRDLGKCYCAGRRRSSAGRQLMEEQ
mmetsp:Transcript_11479/g.26582  ORF Transcript_11479/g.26582 Transcript_11479/m.26582 type:complete len:370 (+) Transcript_11479:98-1207(+)